MTKNERFILSQLSRVSVRQLEQFRVDYAKTYGEESSRYVVVTLNAWLVGRVSPRSESLWKVIRIAVQHIDRAALLQLYEVEISEFLERNANQLQMPSSISSLAYQLERIAQSPETLLGTFWGYSLSVVGKEVVNARIVQAVLEYYCRIRSCIIELLHLVDYQPRFSRFLCPGVSISLSLKRGYFSINYRELEDSVCHIIQIIQTVQKIDQVCVASLDKVEYVQHLNGELACSDEKLRAMRSCAYSALRQIRSCVEYDFERSFTVTDEELEWQLRVRVELSSIEAESKGIKYRISGIAILSLYLWWLVPTRLWILVLASVFAAMNQAYQIVDARKRIRERRAYADMITASLFAITAIGQSE